MAMQQHKNHIDSAIRSGHANSTIEHLSKNIPEPQQIKSTVFASVHIQRGDVAMQPVYGAPEGYREINTTEYECPLCLERDKSLATLPCGHLFGFE